MCSGVADTAPDRTRGRARTIIPTHPQVLESGILQRISPEERKRQEVREAWDMPRRGTKGCGTHVALSGSAPGGAGYSSARGAAASSCSRTGQCWEGSPAQIGGETGSSIGC